MNALLQALQPLFAPVFVLWSTPVSALEAVAFGLAVVMVVLNMRVDPLAWPLAIVSSLLYFALFWNSRLYGDAGLQVFFAVVALWGWRQWRRVTIVGASAHVSTGTGPRTRKAADSDTSDRTAVALRVGRASSRLRWRLLAVLVVAWPATGLFLKTFTNTDVPWWDAFPTALSVIGQWLLGRKYIENWLAWMVVNVASVGLFAYKGLWLTTLLYGVFIAMSVAGWRAWRRLLP